MKKRFGFLIVSTVIFASCASPPQTREEFRAIVDEKFDKSPIDLTGLSFVDAKKRLKDFSEKCLNVEVVKSSPTTSRAGSMTFYSTSTSVTKQKTSLEENGKTATIYLQRDYGDGGGPFTKVPEGGYYVMMIEIANRSPHPVGTVYYYKSFLAPTEQAIMKSALAWIGENKKLCPEY